MSDNIVVEAGETKKKDKYLDKVVPTLFIGVGGTGAEVLWRVRRRILSKVWTGGPQALRLDSLDQFSFAQFLHIDLDFNTVVETGRSSDDPLQSAVSFKPSERYVNKLDLSKYIGSAESLRSFPLVEDWFPLDSQKVAALNINPEKGAGQIRAISRLYFYDRYPDIKSAIQQALSRLRNNVDNAEQHRKLGLTLEPGALRIVVVASTAGGTGSGASIDMGYLSKVLLKSSGASATSNQLVLMLPTGYAGKNAERTQANTYGALMELETCMRGGASHISKWSERDVDFTLPMTPYDDVYFLDTENVAGAKTKEATACFEMAADVLFEDFSTAEFANKKRSIAVNQNQHKVTPYSSRVDRSKYGDMKVTFSRAYSAFGQAILDTQLEQKQSMVVERQVSRMLGVFFGVSSEAERASRAQPTEADRDELLNRLQLGVGNEIVSYEFVASHAKYVKGAECSSAPMAVELLRVNGRSRLESIESNIDQAFDEIKSSGDLKEWPSKLVGLLAQIRRDAIKTVDAGTGLHEDGIESRRNEMRRFLMDHTDLNGVVRALWSKVDNKEKGGLDFSIDLILRMKDRMENPEIGLAKKLDEASRWFADLSGFIDNEEISLLKDHLNQAIGSLFGKAKQAEAKWLQLSQAAKAFVRYHLLSVACREAAVLVRDLSKDLGHKTKTDSNGLPVWAGFIGSLEAGRQNVRDLMADAEVQIARTFEAMKQQHIMYEVLSAARSGVDELSEMSAIEAHDWAEQVFKDFGGTQELFRMLEDKDGRRELTSKLRNQALKHIEHKNKERGQMGQENPLFSALDDLSPSDRQQRLSQLMQRAMPWAALKLDGFLKESKPEDQYQCVVGVKDSKAFEKRYGRDMLNSIPSSSKMTAEQVGFVEISEPGRLICYVELSGIPAPALTALTDWYGYYIEENKKIPVHTHKNLGKFVHVRELSPAEQADRKADLELMIQAVALGVLKRSNKRHEIGALIFKEDGVQQAVGEEKSIRLNSLEIGYRRDLTEKVQVDLAALQSPDQLSLWLALMVYYKEYVYPKRVVRGDDQVDRKEMYLPTRVCEQLAEKAETLLKKAVPDETALRQLKDRASKQLKEWSDEIPGSQDDPYRHEINQKREGDEDPDAGPQPKRVLKEKVFDEAWRLRASAGVQSTTTAPARVPPPLEPVPPPPPGELPDIQFHMMAGGQQYGPYPLATLASYVTTGQLTAASKVWRAGMAGWAAAAQVPELAALFGPPVASALPPPFV